MSETAESSDTGAGNASAVQSISSKLLEVTRLAEKLDAKLCEAGARSQALNPATEDDELATSPVSDDAIDSGVGTSGVKDSDESRLRDQSCKSEEAIMKEPDRLESRASNRSIVEDSSAIDEYVTATECSSVPRSRSESFLSCEYEDGLVSTTCRNAEDEPTIKNEVLPIVKYDAALSTSNPDQHVIEYSPDGATVISRTIQEKGGKIIKETTETTTLRVSHDTRMGVASYKLVSNTIADHTEHLDVRELQDLNRTILGDGTPACKNLQTHREEHTYATPNHLVSYHKSVARNGQCSSDIDDELAKIEDTEFDVVPVRNGDTEDDDELLAMMRTVSEDSDDQCSTSTQQLVRLSNVSCTTSAAVVIASAAVDELQSMLPAPISICEFN